MRTLLIPIAMVLALSSFAQEVSTYNSQVPNHYFDFSLELVKETAGFSPPVAARAFGYMGLTLYEAMVPGMPDYQTTEGLMYELHDVTDANPNLEYHWPTVANNALGLIIDSLFRTMTPANKQQLDLIRQQYNDVFQYTVSPTIYADSKAFGETIATDILDYSRLDGGHNCFAENFPPGYVPPTGDSLWIPHGDQIALQPYWGSHRPFIKADSVEAVSAPPPTFSTEPSSYFYTQALEQYTALANLTPEQMIIAVYWADGGGTMTPAGHSISMLTDVLGARNANLEEAAVAYAKLGIALSDAFLACWKTKFIYNLCRPITYIQAYIDPAWTPLIATPPFPEYPSGHSSQSGAMSTVMTDIFGENYVFIDSTHGPSFGGPRTFSSFRNAAEEAAISRYYGGIHFEFGNEAGLTLGEIVGENVNELFSQVSTSTGAVEKLASVEIYPNPTTNVLHIKSDASLINTPFTLSDAQGKVFDNGELKESITTVKLDGAVPGMYVLQLGDGSSAVKVFIQ